MNWGRIDTKKLGYTIRGTIFEKRCNLPLHYKEWKLCDCLALDITKLELSNEVLHIQLFSYFDGTK